MVAGARSRCASTCARGAAVGRGPSGGGGKKRGSRRLPAETVTRGRSALHRARRSRHALDFEAVVVSRLPPQAPGRSPRAAWPITQRDTTDYGWPLAAVSPLRRLARYAGAPAKTFAPRPWASSRSSKRYYHCAACPRAAARANEALHLGGRLALPAVTRMVGTAAAWGARRKAGALSGRPGRRRRRNAKTVERPAEPLGARGVAATSSESARRQPRSRPRWTWAWNGTGVPMRQTEGGRPDGKQATGRPRRAK